MCHPATTTWSGNPMKDAWNRTCETTVDMSFMVGTPVATTFSIGLVLGSSISSSYSYSDRPSVVRGGHFLLNLLTACFSSIVKPPVSWSIFFDTISFWIVRETSGILLKEKASQLRVILTAGALNWCCDTPLKAMKVGLNFLWYYLVNQKLTSTELFNHQLINV